MSLGPRAIILWTALSTFFMAHWVVILDGAATFTCVLLGFSTWNVPIWAAAISPAWLLGRILYLRRPRP